MGIWPCARGGFDLDEPTGTQLSPPDWTVVTGTSHTSSKVRTKTKMVRQKQGHRLSPGQWEANSGFDLLNLFDV